MAGPRYTVAQTRARVAALEMAAQHLTSASKQNEIEANQFADVILKLSNEATRLRQKAQETRVRDEQQRTRKRVPDYGDMLDQLPH